MKLYFDKHQVLTDVIFPKLNIFYNLSFFWRLVMTCLIEILIFI
jgi:hypothetical protein